VGVPFSVRSHQTGTNSRAFSGKVPLVFRVFCLGVGLTLTETGATSSVIRKTLRSPGCAGFGGYQKR
jgi:hypothetical protein